MKDELPVPVHDAGNTITSTVNMEENYKWQVYFDLKTNAVVGKNLKTVWDLGFETTENGYRIILNSSKGMYAYKTNSDIFSSVSDTIGFEAGKTYDSPTGNLDSTAIGNWKNAANVYIIDRGFDELGIHQGFRKIVFQNVDAEKYIVRFSQLNGIGDTTLIIPKDDDYNFTFLSFSSSSIVSVEPPKAEWDIVFTQYLESLSIPYIVTGCVLNRYNTRAIMDSVILFENVNYEYAQSQPLSSDINSIGYSWKEYDFSTSSYIVFPQMIYIIQDNEGYYYKLHFIDFYNSSGVKGNPKFNYQRL